MISTMSCDITSNGFTPEADYVVGPSGEQLTETDGQGNWVHTNVFAAGQLLATYSYTDNSHAATDTYFALSDWLGTKRAVVSAGGCGTGYVGLPYGDSLTATNLPGFTQCPDATEHHFTGKERDAESGNDYFGARYYASNMGRWMSPDKPFADQHPGNPQSWNLYSYVRNNPLTSIDNNGQVTIEVKYNPIEAGGNHSFIVITDRDGTQTVFRAGPSLRAVGFSRSSGPSQSVGQISGASSGSASQSSTPDSSRSNSSNSSNSASPGAGPTAQGNPFGQLFAQRESPTDPNGDNMSSVSGSVTVLSNDAPAADYLQKLDLFDSTLNSMEIPYNPLSTNSNAYATNALQYLNVPTPQAPVWAPGSGTNLNVVPLTPPNTVPPPPPCSVAGACAQTGSH
ncbi:MAG: RHS repeat-associated core domain-containing protein [Acidobacteriaceae bacterium]